MGEIDQCSRCKLGIKMRVHDTDTRLITEDKAKLTVLLVPRSSSAHGDVVVTSLNGQHQ